jgi:hypothetical protein
VLGGRARGLQAGSGAVGTTTSVVVTATVFLISVIALLITLAKPSLVDALAALAAAADICETTVSIDVASVVAGEVFSRPVDW